MPDEKTHNTKMTESRSFKHIEDRINFKRTREPKVTPPEFTPEQPVMKTSHSKNDRKRRYDPNRGTRGRKYNRKRRIHAVEDRFIVAAKLINSLIDKSMDVVIEEINKHNDVVAALLIINKLLKESSQKDKLEAIKKVLQCRYIDAGSKSGPFVAMPNNKNIVENLAIKEASYLKDLFNDTIVWVECVVLPKYNLINYYARTSKDDAVFNESLNSGRVTKKII